MTGWGREKGLGRTQDTRERSVRLVWDTKGGVQLATGADRVDIGEGGMYVRYASEVDTRRRAWREVRRLADGTTCISCRLLSMLLYMLRFTNPSNF